ncbi:MAG: MFS transporter, partial [Spirochaetota bacterium]
MSKTTRSQQLQSVPFEPARFPFFYGWVLLGSGTIGLLMSAPGQTVGVSVFTDPLMEALGLTRSLLSLGYLVGTLASALLLSRAGRLYDRYGA